jgi:hypothetical protein
MRPISRSVILYRSRKYILLGGQKGDNRPPRAQKQNLGSKISVVVCPIDQEFNIDEENICFQGSKRRKSAIDREFYIEQEKIYFWGSKRQKI